jgi:hypothetical protein
MLQLLAALTTLAICTAKPNQPSTDLCRVIPGDEAWPTAKEWSTFNATVKGKLIRTVPIASICHGDSYDREACAALRDHWYFPETHLPSSSSPMDYPATNNSCNPFSSPDEPCTVGTHVAYTVNATSVDDFKATLQFAKSRNIRLVIRNTGHDYLGKSSGAHAFAVWTRHLKSIELLDDFQSTWYSGKAIKVGAGVDGGQAQDFAHAHGLMIVAGNCPTVGIAGGLSQGGGHSPTASYLGLAADQVIEWEVLTSEGDVVVANPQQNKDLFWALTGGGGGTFGIVVSMTIKAYPEVQTSVATLMVPLDPDNFNSMRSVLTTFLTHLPSAVDAGAFVVWALVPNAFLITPAFAPNLTQPELDGLFAPILATLTSLSLPHTYASTSYPTFHAAFTSTPQAWNVSDLHPSGRLVPRSLITSPSQPQLPALISAILHIASRAMAVGVSYNALPHTPTYPTSVSPHLRTSLFNLVAGLPLNMSATPEQWAEADRYLVHDVLGPLRDLAPEGGAYMNEASLLEPHWEREFFGGNYEGLEAVKRKWDPEEVFFAKRGVASHRWVEEREGRLCRRLEKGEEGWKKEL